MDLRQVIRTIPDFPKPGIQFRDVTTLLKDAKAYRETIDRMVESLHGMKVDVVVGPEARGYAIGAPLAYALGAGFALARKPGKLPYKAIRKEYGLEYGQDALEMHIDAITPGQRVLVGDDLLATGGTARAVCAMVEELGGVVVAARFVIELQGMGGREALAGYDVESLFSFEGD
jgi:adenine phosphoribosyltransferase